MSSILPYCRPSRKSAETQTIVDATETESVSAKRKRPSTAAPVNATAIIAGKGKRIVKEIEGKQISPCKKRNPKLNVNQVEFENEIAKVSEELNQQYYMDDSTHNVFAKCHSKKTPLKGNMTTISYHRQ